MRFRNLKRVLEKGRYVVFIACFTLFIGFLALVLIGTCRLFQVVYSIGKMTFSGSQPVSVSIISASFLSVLDIILQAVVFYLFSITLYELFIGKMSVPEWLQIKSIDDLKANLTSLVILMLAITFTEHLVTWSDGKSIMFYGISTAMVVGVLVYYYQVKKGGKVDQEK